MTVEDAGEEAPGDGTVGGGIEMRHGWMTQEKVFPFQIVTPVPED